MWWCHFTKFLFLSVVIPLSYYWGNVLSTGHHVARFQIHYHSEKLKPLPSMTTTVHISSATKSAVGDLICSSIRAMFWLQKSLWQCSLIVLGAILCILRLVRVTVLIHELLTQICSPTVVCKLLWTQLVFCSLLNFIFSEILPHIRFVASNRIWLSTNTSNFVAFTYQWNQATYGLINYY